MVAMIVHVFATKLPKIIRAASAQKVLFSTPTDVHSIIFDASEPAVLTSYN